MADSYSGRTRVCAERNRLHVQGANVPLGGNDPITGAWFSATNTNLIGAAACAAPYFNTRIVTGLAMHCDWQDANGQPAGPWYGLPGAPENGDQLVVRSVVPIPSALWLFGSGLLGLIGVARRKTNA